MAIDTPAKRLSALDYEEVWAEAIPIPDGSITDGDWRHLVWSYSGIIAIYIPPVPGCVSGGDALAHILAATDALAHALAAADAAIGAVTATDGGGCG